MPSNLSITGVEHTQAIQHFRSQLHLDPASAGPDNDIPLVAGKDTVLRVYVDTGDDPARPTIGQVTGLFEIRVPGGAWIPVDPLNGPIAPIRDKQIRRDDPDATLNFLIPGAFSTDRLDAAQGRRTPGQDPTSACVRMVSPRRYRLPGNLYRVSPSGFFDWKKWPTSLTTERRERLKLLIAEAFTMSDETYGYRRIHAQLARWGVSCGPELVRSIMRELDLQPCQPRPWRFSLTEQDGREHHIPDLLQQDFTADAPGKKLIGDITYIQLGRAGFIWLR